MMGFYESPIATLDFASLYPSIMMTHNLCYSTLVPNSMLNEVKDKYNLLPSGCNFIKTDIKKGLLPMILEELIAARK